MRILNTFLKAMVASHMMLGLGLTLMGLAGLAKGGEFKAPAAGSRAESPLLPPGPQVPDGLGVNIHFTDAKPGELKMISDAGFRWVRMDLTWQSTERTRGVYDFSAYDRLMKSLDDHGLRAMFILDYTNPLYETEASVKTAPGRALFAKWAAAAVAHFKGRGIIWEIWNEPNHRGFWKAEPNAADYTALAVAASQAIRAIAPGECIAAPATSGIDMEFLENCFRGGLLDHIDAVTVHPYRQSGPESVTREYENLRALVRKYRPEGRTIPVLSGEWGYSSVWSGHDAGMQGERLARQWLTNLAAGIPLSIWYDWRDDGKDPKEAEHHFGTVEHDFLPDQDPPFRPKPAWHAAKTLTRALAGTRFVKRLALGTRDDHVMLFTDGKRQVLACWTTAPEAHSIGIPLSANAELITHLGASSPVAKGERVAIPVDRGPRYLVLSGIDPALAAVSVFPELTWNLTRLPGGRLRVAMRNEGATDFDGTLRVTIDGKTVDAAQDSDLPISVPDDHPVTATVQLYSNHKLLLKPETKTLRLAGAELLEGSMARGDGDPKVDSVQTFSKMIPPEPLPGFEAPVWKLDYRLDAGWRYINVLPSGGMPITGSPRAFGMWVHGDGGGAAIRMRVRDANGRTWQPSGPEINWRGWRYVELPLDDQCAHWGGQGAATIRFPLTWDAVFLLDNISRKACSGTVLLASPVLVE